MKILPAVIICLALLAGCRTNSVRNYWDSHSIDYSDIEKAEDQFASFAEMAVASPFEDASAAMDGLFDLMKKDEVAYYIYSSWMDGAFYSILSPCRSAALYSKAVERIVSDGVLSGSECEPFLQKREWIQYNQAGKKAVVPGLNISERTLVLVLDQGWPSCREALSALASKTELADVRHVALCCGYGPSPTVPGWEYITPEDAYSVFDPSMTPVHFIVAADGTVESSYQLTL